MNAAWVAAVAAVAGVLVAARPAKWAWSLLRGTSRFLDDWAGHGDRPGVMDRLAAVEKSLGTVLAETKPNGGHSLRDVVHRTAEDVAQIKDDQAAMRARMELFEHQREERDTP